MGVLQAVQPGLARAVLAAAALWLIATAPAAASESRWFTTSDGVRLHYLEAGPPGAQTVVFIPGWTMPAWIWERQFAALEGRFHVLALDPRGQGLSEVAPFGYAAERRGRDIAELLDHATTGRVVMVGWSLGVLDTLAMIAAEGDDRIAGLVLVDNSIGEGPAPASRPRPAVDNRPSPTPEQRAAMRAAFVDSLFVRDPGPDFRRRLTEAALRMPPDDERRLLAYDTPRTVWRDAVHSTEAPVLYAVRPRFQAQGRALKAARADVQVEVFDRAGHALFVDEPERFNALLIDFLDRRAAWELRP
jgi:microsomal epoxide hydrolase